MAASSSVFNLTRYTALAAGDVIPAVQISDHTQSAHGSLNSLTIANFFGNIPSVIVVTNTTAPQITAAYDSTHKYTISVASSGNTTLNATGSLTITPALTLSAALTYGGVTLSNAVTGTGKMVLDTAPVFASTIQVMGLLTASAGISCTGSVVFTTTVDSSVSVAIGAISPSATRILSGANTTQGAFIEGYGTTYDVSLVGRSGATVLGITANDTIVNVLSDSTSRCFNVKNSHASVPVGAKVEYTAAAPNDTAHEFLFCDDNAATRATIRSNGGLANFQANNANLSDENLKTDIRDLESQWEKHKAIRVVRGKYKDQTHGDDNYMGLAQNIETIYPELVEPMVIREADGATALTVYEHDLGWITRSVLIEAQHRIDAHDSDITALKARLNALEAK